MATCEAGKEEEEEREGGRELDDSWATWEGEEVVVVTDGGFKRVFDDSGVG